MKSFLDTHDVKHKITTTTKQDEEKNNNRWRGGAETPSNE